MSETIRYCVGCDETHQEEDWRWHKKKIKGKTKWYCHKAIYCIGCKKIHTTAEVGGAKSINSGWICRKWYDGSSTKEQRMANMSSEEILSGVQHGLPNQFSTSSEDYTPAVRKQQRQEVLKALR